MSERITEAELSDIVGRTEHAWQHEPGRPDFVERLRLVAEVRRLRGLIAAGVGLVYDPEPKAVVPVVVVVIMAEARAIREERPLVATINGEPILPVTTIGPAIEEGDCRLEFSGAKGQSIQRLWIDGVLFVRAIREEKGASV